MLWFWDWGKFDAIWITETPHLRRWRDQKLSYRTIWWWDRHVVLPRWLQVAKRSALEDSKLCLLQGIFVWSFRIPVPTINQVFLRVAIAYQASRPNLRWIKYCAPAFSRFLWCRTWNGLMYGRWNFSNDEKPDASRSEAALRVDRIIRKLHKNRDSLESLLERKRGRKEEAKHWRPWQIKKIILKI